MQLARTDRSVAEIAALPDLADPGLRAYLRDHGDGLCAETMVYLIRAFGTQGNAGLQDLCTELLVGKAQPDGRFEGGLCEATIRKQARHFGLANNEETWMEFRSRCHGRMMAKILVNSGQNPFWEERFHRALKLLAHDVGEAMRAERDHYVLESDSDGDDEGLPASADTPRTDEEEALLEAIGADAIKDAIRRLPNQQLRRAAWLRWVDEYPITAEPVELSITSMLNVSDSMVRRLIRQAKQLLQADPTIAALKADRARN
jgi:hypothetical protein